MEDRVVYVCWWAKSFVMGETKAWPSSLAGVMCEVCNKPVTAINIDRLLRIEKAMLELGVLSMDGFVAWSLMTKERMAEVDRLCREALGVDQHNGCEVASDEYDK